MATAPVFVRESLADARAGGALDLDGPEGRHAVAVRRLRPGEAVVLTDGAGTGVAGTVADVHGRDRLSVAVDRVWHEPPPRPWLTVVQALPKGDRGELAVETMTETGVDAVVPWAAARCVTQWRGERGARALGRWRATAREAGKQARRVRFPRVTEPHTTAELVRALAAPSPAFGPEQAGGEPAGGGEVLVVVLHESATAPLATAPLAEAAAVVLVVGPEGGVTDEELTAFTDAGAHPHRLGPTVLRTSTAGTAAAAVVLARSGRWG